MKRFAIAILLCFAALPIFSQSGTLQSSVTATTKTNVIIGNISEHRADPAFPSDINSITITLWMTTAAGAAHPDTNTDITATLTGTAIGAYMDARSVTTAGENASGAARQQFRVLTWLKANTGTAGVTIRCNDPTQTAAQCAAIVANITVGTS